ncbi:MAG: hypothetical protein JO141_30000 [Bradyrhizobium sp.]|nr:hypothetical protein [Bradyrhizobium sp.]
MRLTTSRHILVLAFAALSLGACASRNEVPAYEHLSSEDDDAYCQQGGRVKIGTPDYVYCRKERDAARNAAVARADRKQRDLAEYMMNNPR